MSQLLQDGAHFSDQEIAEFFAVRVSVGKGLLGKANTEIEKAQFQRVVDYCQSFLDILPTLSSDAKNGFIYMMFNLDKALLKRVGLWS